MRPTICVLSLALVSCGTPMYGEMSRAPIPGRVAATAAPLTPAPEARPNTESYDRIYENDFVAVADQPLSTFSIDVDTASYSNVRRFLRGGKLPPPDAVRIEELVNYFDYDYPDPEGDAPLAINAELSRAPWRPEHLLMRVGLQAKRIDASDIPPRNLVFLLDVSGSMSAANKLPLLKESLGLLADQLDSRDRVSIVVYAGASGTVLPPTPGSDKQAILGALDKLRAGGSTNGGAGIELAYRLAEENFDAHAINRVILATDGDFNVGVTDQGSLVRLIEKKRESGVFLTVLGLGMGNLKDSTMEKLADKGNGNYAYIDTLAEARKVLVTEAGSTLVTLAKDVKIQVEFNPAEVKEYRLVGYENRLLKAQDFNDDKKDAGEVGAGHSVTALYELVPAGAAGEAGGKVDPLKYQAGRDLSPAAASGELVTLKLRYKEPDGSESKLITRAVAGAPEKLEEASTDLRFSAAVAGFGMLLRDSKYKGQASFAMIDELGRAALGDDPHGYREEFLQLVARASTLSQSGTREAQLAR